MKVGTGTIVDRNHLWYTQLDQERDALVGALGLANIYLARGTLCGQVRP